MISTASHARVDAPPRPRVGMPHLLGCLAVLLGVIAMSVGLPLLNRAIPNERHLADGQRISIGSGVTMVPPQDAELVANETDPLSGVTVLNINSVRYVVHTEATDDNLEQATEKVREAVEGLEGFQTIGDEANLTSDQGIPGKAAAFATTDQAGLYAVYVNRGFRVSIITRGADAAFRANSDQIEASLTTVTFGGSA